jgi:hypothetical protein
VTQTKTIKEIPKRKTKANWMLVGVGIVVVYFGVLVYNIGPKVIWDFVTTTKELNSVGDFLAGLFAVPAFILLAAAVATQRQELDEAREQFQKSQEVVVAQMEQIENQNHLARKTANANYMLQIHDKRIKIFDALLECGAMNYIEGDMSKELRGKLYSVMRQADFVFGDEIREWTTELNNKAAGAQLTVVKISMCDKHIANGKAVEFNQAARVALYDELQRCDIWFQENLSPHMIKLKLSKHLRLPESLD